MAPTSFVRDTLIVDQSVQAFYDGFGGAGPVALLGREVVHAPGFALRVTAARPLLVVADVYDSNGGMIDARGFVGATGAAGANGAPSQIIQGVPGPAGGGHPGAEGGPGSPGGAVTLVVRDLRSAHVSVVGGPGGRGGNGGAGGRGGDGFPEIPPNPEIDLPGEPGIPGASGGPGGPGGRGGFGGPGGTIVFVCASDASAALLETGGGVGGQPGPGGPAGADGRNSVPICPEFDPFCTGPEGEFGVGGDGPGPDVALVAAADLAERIRASTGALAVEWAAYRVLVGEFFHRRYNPAIPELADLARMAAAEFATALQLDPGNADARRLLRELIGFAEEVPGTGELVMVGGGNNALGLPRDLDLLPDFESYMRTFAGLSGLVLEFLGLGSSAILTAEEMQALHTFVSVHRAEATAVVANVTDDLALAETEQRIAVDEVGLLQKRLDDVAAEIQAARPVMEQKQMGIGAIIGTVASVGAAVVAVIGAIPTAGASLVALVPSMVALSKAIADSAEPVARALFAGQEADLSTVKAEYKKVGENIDAVVKASQSVVNFVRVIQQLNASATPDNAKQVALVKRGAELAHEMLVARQRVSLAGQRVGAVQARLGRAQALVTVADQAAQSITQDAASVRRVGLFAIEAARSKVDVLLELAFRAQRSLEIYTLESQVRHVQLDAGHLHPDVSRAYAEGLFGNVALFQALTASWAKLLSPLGMQGDFEAFFLQNPQQDRDVLRLSLTDPEQLNALRLTNRLPFRLEVSDLPASRFDTKIEKVEVSLVGATSPSDVISCEVWHGGRYEQRRRDGSVDVQLLPSRRNTRQAGTTRLVLDGFSLAPEPPLTAPRSLGCWGRGVGGDWEVRIPRDQSNGDQIGLAALTEVQVWIGYSFLH